MELTAEQKQIAEDARLRFEFIAGYNPAKHQRYDEAKFQKLEIIKESAIPQPFEWELGFYFALDGSNAGVKNRIFVDESESYKRNGHPLWVYVEFQNIKSKNPHAYYGCFYLPITVEKNPQVVGDIEGLGINPKIISNVKRFISGNVKWFQDIADKKIRGTKVKPVPIFFLKENKNLLVEMANFLKDETGLPMNIWLDQGCETQHAERIKFQNDYSDNFDENNLCTLKLFGDMGVVGNTRLKNHDINRLRNFCKTNKKYIDLIYKGAIDRDGFINQMTKVDNKGTPIPKQQSPNSTWVVKKGMTRFNISVVISNSGKYNYVKNNQLLCNNWFDEAHPFQVEGERKVAFTRNGDTWYQVDENGGIVEYMGQNEV